MNQCSSTATVYMATWPLSPLTSALPQLHGDAFQLKVHFSAMNSSFLIWCSYQFHPTVQNRTQWWNSIGHCPWLHFKSRYLVLYTYGPSTLISTLQTSLRICPHSSSTLNSTWKFLRSEIFVFLKNKMKVTSLCRYMYVHKITLVCGGALYQHC